MPINFKDCPHLIRQADGSYKLKESHTDHYQIMGQLGLTVMPWCGFYVMCTKDKHQQLFDAVR